MLGYVGVLGNDNIVFRSNGLHLCVVKRIHLCKSASRGYVLERWDNAYPVSSGNSVTLTIFPQHY